MGIHVATANDIAAVLAIAEHFIAESDYGMQFDSDASTAYIEMLIDHPEVAVFLEDAGQAVAIVAISRDWCKQPVAYVEKLYVMPAARGTGAARCLVDAAVEFATQHGCSHVFSTATAGMGELVAKLFSNLFGKFGFVPCGPVLCRSL